MQWKRITIEEHERALVLKNGRPDSILTPGQYRIFVDVEDSLALETHTVSDVVFESMWADYLVRNLPELVGIHFHRVETGETQLALVYVDGGLHAVLTPLKRLLFWRGRAQIAAEFVEIIGTPQPAAKQSAARAC